MASDVTKRHSLILLSSYEQWLLPPYPLTNNNRLPSTLALGEGCVSRIR